MQYRDKPLSVVVRPCDEAPETLTTVEVSGYLDSHTVQEFDREMTDCLGEGRTRLIVDAGRLQYISSAGIGSLMRLVQEVRQREGGLVLLQPPEKVFAVLDLLGFTRVFRIAPDAETAARELLEDL